MLEPTNSRSQAEERHSAQEGPTSPPQTAEPVLRASVRLSEIDLASTPYLEPAVLVINFDPTIRSEGNKQLRQVLGWRDPRRLADEYIADLVDCSADYVRYTIAEWVDADAWPAKADGFRYDEASYLQAWRSRDGWHEPDAVDYEALIAEYDLVSKINSGQIDEVWLFGFPYAGFYESIMVGPGAFWCNSPPMQRYDVTRRFTIMGFNYERGVGPMLESFGHRVESMLTRAFDSWPGSEPNPWQRFARYEKIAPSEAGCGTMHHAPNSIMDFDWGNEEMVWSTCDDWPNYPHLTGARREVNCEEWGNGDIRLHHLWWLRHLPRARGHSGGKLDNWWIYAVAMPTEDAERQALEAVAETLPGDVDWLLEQLKENAPAGGLGRLLRGGREREKARKRRDVAGALGESGNPRAVQPLVDLLQDRATEVRLAAAEALGRLGDPRALEPLTELLRAGNDDPEVLEAVSAALEAIEPGLDTGRILAGEQEDAYSSEGYVGPEGLTPGELLDDRYRIEEIVAVGGLSATYRAHDLRLDRWVVVEVVTGPTDAPQFSKAFARECQSFARLAHPNLVQIVDFDPDHERPFLVRQPVGDERRLSALLAEQQRLSSAEALPLLAQAGQALDYIHQQGIVHRHVKPGHILLADEGEPLRAVLLDACITRALQAGSADSTVGAPEYMSPELARNEFDRVGPATDVYGLGLVAYEMLAGRPPFEGTMPIEVMIAHISQTPPSPQEFNPELSDAVSAVILKALAKDPGERHPSAGEFAAALEGAFAAPEKAADVEEEPEDPLQAEIEQILARLEPLYHEVQQKEEALAVLQTELAEANLEYESATRSLMEKEGHLRAEIAELQALLRRPPEVEERGGAATRVSEPVEGTPLTPPLPQIDPAEKYALRRHVFRVVDPSSAEGEDLLAQLNAQVSDPDASLGDMLAGIPWGPVWFERVPDETQEEQIERLVAWETALKARQEFLEASLERLRRGSRARLLPSRRQGPEAWQAFLDETAARLRQEIDMLEQELNALREAVGEKEGEAEPPPEYSLLGAHVNAAVSGLPELIQEWKPPLIVTIDHDEVWHRVKTASPNTLFVGRLFQETEPYFDDARLDPLQAARDHCEQVLLLAQQMGATYDYWQGLNEPIISSAEAMARYAEFEVERARIMAQNGFRVVVGSFATGGPDLALYQHFLPALEAARQYGGALALHLYAWPRLERDAEWYALRYRKVYYGDPDQDWQGLPAHLQDLPLLITECGLDATVEYRPSGQGWRDRYQDEPEQYLQQLAWYDAQLRQDPFAWAAAIYCCGTVETRSSYDIWPDLAQTLAEKARPRYRATVLAATRTMRVGLHGRNGVSFQERDYEAIDLAGIETLKMLSFTDVDVYERLRQQNPDLDFIVRLFDDRISRGARPDPADFAARMIPLINRLQPYALKFEIHNEPNHTNGIEGWGSSDADAHDFRAWYLEVLHLLREACPWARFGFPALAPGDVHRDLAWLEICRDAIEASDWLACHCYWQGDDQHHEAWGQRFRLYHDRFPTMRIAITEFGNATPNLPAETLAAQYVPYYQALYSFDYLDAACAFLASAPDPVWELFVWVTESGELRPVVEAVGTMARPPLVEPEDAPVKKAELQYWFVTANPTQYDWDRAFAAGNEQWTNVRGHAAQNNLQQARPGDVVLAYRASPNRYIAGLGHIAAEPYEYRKRYAVQIDMDRKFKEGVSLYELQAATPELAHVRNPRVSFSPVTDEQWATIRELILYHNPDLPPEELPPATVPLRHRVVIESIEIAEPVTAGETASASLLLRNRGNLTWREGQRLDVVCQWRPDQWRPLEESGAVEPDEEDWLPDRAPESEEFDEELEEWVEEEWSDGGAPEEWGGDFEGSTEDGAVLDWHWPTTITMDVPPGSTFPISDLSDVAPSTMGHYETHWTVSGLDWEEQAEPATATMLIDVIEPLPAKATPHLVAQAESGLWLRPAPVSEAAGISDVAYGTVLQALTGLYETLAKTGVGGEWLHVRTLDGREGWAEAENLQLRGWPRIQCERTYILLPPDSEAEWALAAVEATWARLGWTVGTRIDDAGIGALDVRRVLAVNPAAWSEDLPKLFATYYPGVQYTALEADTPEELGDRLRQDGDFSWRTLGELTGQEATNYSHVPREQYKRLHVLVHPEAGVEWARAAVRATWERDGVTVGSSADEACLGDLDTCRIIGINPDAWPGDLESFCQQHYPGVELTVVTAERPEEVAYRLEEAEAGYWPTARTLARLSIAAQEALGWAEAFRQKADASVIYTEYLLAGLYQREDTTARRLLTLFYDEATIEDRLETVINRETRTDLRLVDIEPLQALPEPLDLSPRTQNALLQATILADEQGSELIRAHYLLAGLLAVGESVAGPWIADELGVDREILHRLLADAPAGELPIHEIYYASDHRPELLEGHEAAVNSLDFGLEGLALFSGSDDATVRTWNLLRGTFTSTEHPGKVQSVATTPEGERLFTTLEDGTLIEANLLDGEVTTIRPSIEGADPYHLARSPDGRWLATWSMDGEVVVDDRATGEQQTLSIPDTLSVVAVASGGQYLACGLFDHSVLVVDLPSGEERLRLAGHKETVWALAFMPDANHVVSTSQDTTLKVWDLETGEELFTLHGHQDAVVAVLAVPGRPWVVSGAADTTLRVWDTGTGRQLAALSEHEGTVTALALSPDGRLLASGDGEGAIRLWDLEAIADGLPQPISREEALDRLAFTQTDLLELPADVWLNSTSSRLSLGNTGQKIAEILGPSFELELRETAPQPVGSAIVTQVEGLPARYVLSVPIYDSAAKESPTADTVRQAVQAALRQIETLLEVRTLVIPSIATTWYADLPLSIAATVVETTIKHLELGSRLERITFSNPTLELHLAYLKAYTDLGGTIEGPTWFSRLSPTTSRALDRAEHLRRYRGDDQLDTRHLLWGLYRLAYGTARELLTTVASDEQILQRLLDWVDAPENLDLMAIVEADLARIPFTPDCQQALEEASRLAGDAPLIRERQVLAGLLAVPESEATRWLVETVGLPVGQLYDLVAVPGEEEPAEPLADALRRALIVDVDVRTYWLSLEMDVETRSIGTPFDLTLTVSGEEQPNSTQLLVPTSTLELALYVKAPRFHLEGEHPLILPIDPTRRPERGAPVATLSFALTPLSDGQQQVQVLVYPGRRVTGLQPAELPLRVQVERPVSLPRIPELIDRRAIPDPKPDLIFYVALAPGGRALNIYVTFPALGELHPREQPPLALGEEDVAALRQAAIHAAAEANDAPPPDARAGLRAFGAALFDRLMPEGHPLRLLYWHKLYPLAGTSEHLLSWLVVSDEQALLPWEMVCPYFAPGGDGAWYDEFLGAKFVLTHWVGRKGLKLAGEAPLGKMNLTHYGQRPPDELKRWQAVLGGDEVVTVETESGRVALAKPRSPRYGLHILRYVDPGPETGLVTAAGEPVQSRDEEQGEALVRDPRLDFALRRPVVGLSFVAGQTPDREAAGQPAAPGPISVLPLDARDTRLESSWLVPLLAARTSALVGTRWPVRAGADRLFFQAFYQKMRAGASLGWAAWYARQQVRAAYPHRADWLAYTYFGHPWCQPYLVRPGRGYTIFEQIDHPEDAPLLAGETYRFRASYRTEAPAWFTGRLRIQEAPLEGEGLSVVVMPLAGAQPGRYPLEQVPDSNDYQHTLELTMPQEETTMTVMVRFQRADQEIRTMLVELDVQAKE